MTYYINFSDHNPNRTILVNENTFHGSPNPFTATGAPGAAKVDLSISLYGKDQVNYGERIQENLVQLLENFSGASEPTLAINGQIWCDRSVLPNSLKVFNSQKHIITNTSTTITNLIIEISGSISDAVRYTDMILNSNNRFIVVSPDPVYTPNIPIVQSEKFKTIEFTSVDTSVVGTIKLTVPLVPAGHYISPVLTPSDNNLIGWYIGGWETILQSNNVGGTLDMHNNSIINVLNPVNLLDVVNYQTLQSYVASHITAANTIASLTDVTLSSVITGDILVYDTISGMWKNVPLSSSTLNTNITTPQNNDLLVYNTSLSAWVNLSPYSHPSLISFAPTHPSLLNADILMYDNIQNSWVNTPVSSHPAGIITATLTSLSNNDTLVYDSLLGAWINVTSPGTNFLPLTGGTMVGTIDTGGNTITNLPTPIDATDAATKQYVDSGDIVAGNYNSATGGLSLYTGANIININPDPVMAGVRAGAVQPLDRVIMITDGTSSTYDFSTIDPLFEYRYGYNQLAVFVNGIKQYQDTHGYLLIDTNRLFYNITNVNIGTSKFTIAGNHVSEYPAGLKIWIAGSTGNNGYYIVSPGGAILNGANTDIPVTTAIMSATVDGVILFSDILQPAIQTGLISGTMYDFKLGYNGNPQVTYTIDGANAQTVETLIYEINLVLSTGTAPVFASLHVGKIKFLSETTGTSSSITLADGTGTHPLFANLIGSSSSIINIANKPTFAASPSASGQVFAYSAVGAFFGATSTSITFTSVPAAGMYIEATVNYLFT